MRRWTLPLLITTMLFAGLSADAAAKARKGRSRHGVKASAPAEVAPPDTEAAEAPDKEAADGAESSSAPSPELTPEATEEQPAEDSPEPVAAAAEPRPAHLQIFCPLPGADVLIDEEVVGKTPLADAVIVTPGKHIVELRRAGYMTSWREITVDEGAQRSVAFHPEEDPESEDPRGRLVIGGGAGDVRVTVDGRSRGRYDEPITLPAGPHHIKLERKGFEPVEKLVDVPPGDAAEIQAPLVPTQDTQAAHADHVRVYRRWALAALISGAVVAGGSTGVALWGNSKIGGAEDKLAKVRQDNDAAGCDDPGTPTIRLQVCQQNLSAAQSDVDKYRSWRTRGIIGAGVGAALVATGVVLWLIAPDAEPDTGDEAQASTLLPVISAGPEGASLWLRGSF